MSLELTPETQKILSQANKQDLKYYAETWFWRAVESLVTAKDFDPSPKAISSRLNISVEQAVDALEGLARLSLIERSGSTFIKKESVTFIGTDNLTKRDLLEIHSKIAPQLASKLTEDSIFLTRICLGSYELVRKHRVKIQEFLNSLDEEGSQLNSPSVMAVEISITDLSRSLVGGLQ